MAGGNKERAMLLMANHVQAATAIYKNTGFAVVGKPEGMVINLILFQLSFKLLHVFYMFVLFCVQTIKNSVHVLMMGTLMYRTFFLATKSNKNLKCCKCTGLLLIV